MALCCNGNKPHLGFDCTMTSRGKSQTFSLFSIDLPDESKTSCFLGIVAFENVRAKPGCFFACESYAMPSWTSSLVRSVWKATQTKYKSKEVPRGNHGRYIIYVYIINILYYIYICMYIYNVYIYIIYIYVLYMYICVYTYMCINIYIYIILYIICFFFYHAPRAGTLQLSETLGRLIIYYILYIIYYILYIIYYILYIIYIHRLW